jgi:hypothetical protein
MKEGVKCFENSDININHLVLGARKNISNFVQECAGYLTYTILAYISTPLNIQTL